MFYIVLFLLACYNLTKSVKNFVRDNVVIVDGKCIELSTEMCVSAVAIVMFHVMVFAICLKTPFWF